ncbi:hypothetical protein GMO_16580 [Gluconobacter morbifer G707]|uniref:Uncharacterized protein n=1 Tax=Gluconobacter morbifer G707 TaxID=1088869 RepID=G6XJS9_9PROT|nr:hypothetical protein GMO_16580 [Gluconobacter morbifer G707]
MTGKIIGQGAMRARFRPKTGETGSFRSNPLSGRYAKTL